MDKLIISIHNKFLPEKKYIIDTIMTDFLGLDYELRIVERASINYTIKIRRKGTLFFEDNFFANFDEETGFLSKEALPGKPYIYSSNKFTEGNIPIIFGHKRYSMSQFDKKVDLISGIDVFASTFFLLTRWEEIVLNDKDDYGRFDEEKSYLIKHNLFKRPLVNEYVDYIWNMLQYMGFEGERKDKKYTVYPTHDIDYLRRYPTKKTMLRTVLGNLKRNRKRYFFKDLKGIYNTIKDPSNDPYLNFDFLMSVSERCNLKSQFFIIPSEEGETDSTYSLHDPEIEKLISNVKERGHQICYHASRATQNNAALFKRELNRIRSKGVEVHSVRQHYLQFSTPFSWQISNDFGVKNSSNMGYSNRIGFRSGCCYEYNVFNVQTREKLDIIEWPLIFMESALIKYAKDKTGFYQEAVDLAFLVRKYRGNFVFLWHNSSFTLPEWRPVSYMYNWFVNEVNKKK